MCAITRFPSPNCQLYFVPFTMRFAVLLQKCNRISDYKNGSNDETAKISPLSRVCSAVARFSKMYAPIRCRHRERPRLPGAISRAVSCRYHASMKHDVLRSVAHNVAASLASGVGLLIGVHQLDVFGDARRSPRGNHRR